ncbi:MAG TPA: hypothetical protein VGK73_27350 [Polyangiaceae bacterium]
MRLPAVTRVFFVSLCLVLACGKGGGSGKEAKSSDKDSDEVMVYDEDGKGFVCEDPESQCDDVKEVSLDFKEHCRTAGYKIRQCGCTDACTGNINGERVGYTNKNVEKKCPKAEEKCELVETSAAFQDACTDAGEQLVECGCEWLCSGKLKEVVPDAPKEDESKPAEEEAGKDDKSKDKKGKDDKSKSKMSMDGPVDDKPKKK